jgi:peptidoglycan/LPS O-acetylase OafA/YrhL
MQNAVPSEAQNHVIHIWSVDAEAIFYILLPIVAVLAGRLARDRGDRRSRLAWTFAAVAVAVVFSFLWRARHPVDLAWQRYTAGVLFAIAIGMGLAALEIVAVAWARGLRRAALIGDGLFVLGWVVLLGLSGQGDAGAPLRTILSAIACALVMGGPLLRQWAGAGCSPWLDNRVMHAIGRWSYSIFLFHLVVLQQIASRVHFDSAWGTAAVVLPTVYVLAVALGALSFQLIEKPCMRFRGVSSQPTAKPQHEPVNLGAEPSAGSEPLPGVPDPQSA